MRTLAAILALVLLVAVAGALLGWWAALAGLLRGTAGPVGGYSCLPSPVCDQMDAKFMSLPGENMDSFGGARIVVWVTVPQGEGAFELSFFDGDSGLDNNGNVNWRGGNWDNTTTETSYTLYADPLKDGVGGQVVGQWSDRVMVNNDWYSVSINNVLEARSPSGDHSYRLEAVRPLAGQGINAFKLRSTGFLSAGQTNLVDASFAVVGGWSGLNDLQLVYPEFGGDYNNLGPSVYAGEWQFYVYVPQDAQYLEIWDGDFDRGTSLQVGDSDDPNTVGKPPWASPLANDEGAWGRGSPADDSQWFAFRREPPVWYEVIDPAGTPIYTNHEPSGTEEWEKFLISTDPSADADLHVAEVQPGFYNVHIVGLDLGNTVWLNVNHCISSVPEACKPACDATCPRTIGYWKNNVKKVLIDGKTNGVQETVESINSALYLIAQYSPLYRSGIDVNNPQAIGQPTPLSAAEANMILQRDQKNYPGGKDAANSMLARALQQNLATWLNWASGKICSDTWVTLDAYGGYFEGTVWDALQAAQTIMLNHDDAQMERAKDIGDLINNGLLGEDAEDSTCEDYAPVMPPDKQKPKPENLPKAPKQPDPPNPVPQPITCDAPRVNTYGVENPTDNPFYGIKFEYQSGTEIKNSDFDEFRFVLPADVAANMSSIQVEAKAGGDQAISTVTLDNCAFNSPVPCGDPVQDANGFFAFYFMGAKDNGDGTLTLVFQVQNFTGHGLSHATFGLPDGVVPSGPNGSYQSQVCP